MHLFPAAVCMLMVITGNCGRLTVMCVKKIIKVECPKPQTTLNYVCKYSLSVICWLLKRPWGPRNKIGQAPRACLLITAFVSPNNLEVGYWGFLMGLYRVQGVDLEDLAGG